MGRFHGRNGAVYLASGPSTATDGSQVAGVMAFLSDWSISFSTNKVDVTCMGDTNLVYVAGLPDASGDFSGFMDSASGQTYEAATDGLPRNFYLYPNTNEPGSYFYGQILPDYSVSGSVTTAVTLKSSWNAAGRITKVPYNGIAGS
jgi:hypothetical protein